MTPLEKLPERLFVIVRMFKRAYWYNLLYYTCTDMDRGIIPAITEGVTFQYSYISTG